MAKRAILGVTEWSRSKRDLRSLARAVDAGRHVAEADYELNFADAADLLAQITRERLRLLTVLRQTGPCSVYALAKTLERNYSNVHADVRILAGIGLIERDRSKRVLVPWKEIHIHVPLSKAA